MIEEDDDIYLTATRQQAWDGIKEGAAIGFVLIVISMGVLWLLHHLW